MNAFNKQELEIPMATYTQTDEDKKEALARYNRMIAEQKAERVLKTLGRDTTPEQIIDLIDALSVEARKRMGTL
jgi:hypothetical protein